MSAHEQWDMSFDNAMSNEFERGMKSVDQGETLQGAEAFTIRKRETW